MELVVEVEGYMASFFAIPIRSDPIKKIGKSLRWIKSLLGGAKRSTVGNKETEFLDSLNGFAV